jgi:hypothetical protein
MSETTRENASWRKEKSPVIFKYLQEHAKMLTEIAGRGFLNLPGYAYDLENDIETQAKFSLSDINHKILAETIERELKQSGIDYDLAYKSALLAWELEKQGLMTAWLAELAGIKQGMASDEETKKVLALAVSARQVTLIASKTALEIEAEGYRQTLAGLDDDTAAYEVNLANAKLMTAQKKIELIPIVQRIIVKEQELLALESTKYDEYDEYVAAKVEVANKKETGLQPEISELASKNIEYSLKISNEQIPTEGLIADEKVLQANYATQKSASQILEIQQEIINLEKSSDTLDARINLQNARHTTGEELRGIEARNIVTVQTKQETDSLEIRNAEITFGQTAIANKNATHSTDNNAKKTSASTLSVEKRYHIANTSNIEIEEMNGVTTAQKAAEISATLNHLIG